MSARYGYVWVKTFEFAMYQDILSDHFGNAMSEKPLIMATAQMSETSCEATVSIHGLVEAMAYQIMVATIQETYVSARLFSKSRTRLFAISGSTSPPMPTARYAMANIWSIAASFICGER